MQEKILRVIEYGELQRVGGSETISVDVRIVGSTNSDLQALAEEGGFRKDLLDRLAFDVITIPPLRERIEDILPLAYAFAVNMVAELELPLFPGFGARASSSLLRHDWPGNVRELKNAVERSVYRLEDKSKQISKIAFDPFDSPFRLRRQTTRLPPAAGSRKGRHILPVDLKDRLHSVEVELIEAALERARFNQRVAAEPARPDLSPASRQDPQARAGRQPARIKVPVAQESSR